ncbi:MAG: RAMP superfamily CRISPR-associated protein [Clostridium sp.]|uniref:RAMP superfamily CRISPR-associated protein n=1 Tax=Clostridium sp. TaxID=1506 RepID=UPI003F351FCE
MKEYSIKIEFKSEAILGSGKSTPGYIDFDIVYDEYGLPYLKGKTFKGKLREEGENISRLLKEEYPKELVNNLFGYKKDGGESKIYFSDFTVGENLKNVIKNEVLNGNIDSKEVLEAMTNVRNFTAIDKEGVAKDGSLRKIRVLKKGLVLNGKIEVDKELTEKEEELIRLALGTLKHIGLMGNRGKGEIECSIKGLN